MHTLRAPLACQPSAREPATSAPSPCPAAPSGPEALIARL
ncbi:MAG: hypothetical protein QOK11_3129, partial [Pseudonocardiales bacterium]|nr:hypothetical protein [Pseudonocardiales bacterium]